MIARRQASTLLHARVVPTHPTRRPESLTPAPRRPPLQTALPAASQAPGHTSRRPAAHCFPPAGPLL